MLITTSLNIYLNISRITSFFVGIGVGFILMLLLYLYAVIKSLNKKLKIRKVDVVDINEEEIKWLIDDAVKRFKNKHVRKENGFAKHLMQTTKELAYDISSKFYPKSKYPYLELTVDETLVLAHYVTNRIEELFDSKLLKLFRRMTLRKVAEINNQKNKIEETKVVKAAKKFKLGNVFSKTLKVINIANPVTWIKRLTFDQAINLITVKIGIAVVQITGEETYKIYSKKVFNEDKEFDLGVNDLFKDFSDMSEEDF